MTTSLVAIAVLVPFVLAVAFAWYLDGRDHWYDLLSDRLLYGVPWGTLVVVGIVLAVYFFVQGGLRHWSNPLVIPFRSWSYLYPTGLVFSGFSHASPGHLTGNLLATVVLAPIAEYAWGHYPPGTCGSDQSDGGESDPNHRLDEFASSGTPAASHFERLDDIEGGTAGLLQRPWVRAVVVFPLAVVGVGFLTALFFAGPVIGFSGVVFAFGGFALVRYPILTLVGLLVTSVVSTTYRAITDPFVVQGITQSAPSAPSWASIAVQAHALGILVGVVLGLALVVSRGERPNAGRIFLATLVYGVTRNLWAIYWFASDGQYVLARALGLVLVVGLAILVTAAATVGDDVERWWTDETGSVGPTKRQFATGWVALLAIGLASAVGAAWLGEWPFYGTVATASVLAVLFALPVLFVFETDVAVDLDSVAPEQPTIQRAFVGGGLALFTLVLVTVAVGAVAVFPNAVTLGDEPVPGEGSITVQDYEVTYEENVRNQQIPAIDLPVLRDQTHVPTSGVIVVSERRHVWSGAVSRQHLQSQGRASVTVGGLGWRDSVRAERTGWNVAGNGSVYVVDLSRDVERVRSFTSDPRRAEHRIAGHNVTIAPGEREGFRLQVDRRGERVGETRLPTAGNETSVGDLTLRTERVNDRSVVYAVEDETRVRVATRERHG